MRAIAALEPGGPEVLHLQHMDVPAPGPGQLLVTAHAAGVNFIDTYRRAGIYPMTFPHIVGSEGAGVVSAVGEGVPRTLQGRRVAWTDAPGSYAEQVLVQADRALPVPDGVSDDLAAAAPLQGLTAHYLATSTYPIQAGEWALVHAAAGGVGLLLTQLIRSRGGHVVATVSTQEKAELARAAGAEVVIRYDQLESLPHDLPPLVREASSGGVHVVYDGVGRATFDASLASLRPRGVLALFGGSSGQVPAFDLQRLNTGGSLYVTRPSLGAYVATRDELIARSDDLFARVLDGSLDVRIGARFPLSDAAAAHRALESRATTGKVILEV